jgi:RNA polymerase sigma factor (sigma-70 family)
MTNGQPNTLVNHIRQIVAAQTLRDSSDRDLVEWFVSRHDEAAFAALVERHGSMVLGVCRRVLRCVQDAEDASQATFLVLARKARAIRKKDSLGSWLHGVAFRVASDLKKRHARRHAGTGRLDAAADTDTVAEVTWREVQATLDEELQKLPEHYRAPLILCYLEGKARDEAAQQLGWSLGTLKNRLEGARESLRRRLVRRGIAPSVGLLSAVFTERAAEAMSATLALATVKSAPLAALGQAIPGSAIPRSVVTLAEGVVNAMFMSKLKAVVGVVLALSLLVSGATVLAFRTATASASHLPPAREQPAKEHPAAAQKQELEKTEVFTAWGKEVGGLQAGLGFRRGAKRAYSFGDTVTFAVRLRNVSKDIVSFQYLYPHIENPLTVTDSTGKSIPNIRMYEIGSRQPLMVRLAPGKEMALHELRRALKPATESENKEDGVLYGTGKVSIQYEQVLGDPNMGLPGWKLDPILSKLATGKLELEVESDPPPPAGQDTRQKKDARDTNQRPIKIRVYIEKVNEDTATIAASCMLIGEMDGVTKPVRFENLRVGDKARITDRGRILKLADLKSLPRGTHYHLFLNTYEEAFGFEVVGIETIRPDAAIEENPTPKKGPPAANGPPTRKIRVVIEKVNLETATLTASCLLVGLTDNVTRPVRMEHLQVAVKAKITDRGKELTLEDLNSLPRDTHFYLLLRVYEGEEFGFEVVAIDTIPPPANAPRAPQKPGIR